MNLDYIQKSLGKATSSLATILKVALMSRRGAPKGSRKNRSLVVMGNGPSLRATIDQRLSWLKAHDLLAVNFAANTPEYTSLRPCHYVLADSHFFTGIGSDPNVARLWDALRTTDWDMTLRVPVKRLKEARRLLEGNSHVDVKAFNLTPLEGFDAICHPLMDAGLGMPRPRNVMIPSIMTAIREGYRKIYLVGADHTWTRTLSVDSENFVVSVQPHFYEDNSEEQARVRQTYAGLHLHDVLGSMTVAFRSYWDVARYARSRGVEIINATPGSMIDAFPRESR